MVQALKDITAMAWYFVRGAGGGVPAGGVPILTYHSVGLPGDPFFPSLPLGLFERQVRYLSRCFHLLSFGSFLDRIRNGDPFPSRTAILTFDDGYKDNFRLAFPILRKYGAPATIFLSTGSIGTQDILWFDRLAYAVKTTPLRFLEWEAGEERQAFALDSVKERLSALARIKKVLKTLPNPDRLRCLEALEKTLGTSGIGNPKDRMLEWDEVRIMDQAGIEMGGHTVSHPILKNLTRDEARIEIRDCVESIEGHLQKKVRSFAYPNGTERDFGPEIIDILKNSGIHGACTTIEGMASSGSQPFSVPRIYATDRNFFRFFWRLSHLSIPSA